MLKWKIAKLVDEREREKRQGEAYVKKTNINQLIIILKILSYKCFHAQHLAEVPAGYPNKNSKNRKIESVRGTMGRGKVRRGREGYSLMPTPILSLKVKNQIRRSRKMFPVRDCIYAHHNQTTQKQTK